MPVFEYDDDGKEWIGYTFGCEETDHVAVINALTGNVQYLEWFFRQIVGKSKLPSLAEQLNYLFELLPSEAESAITDQRSCLIRDIVQTRNRYAHGKFEEPAPSIERVYTLSIKVAALLCYAELVHEGHPDQAVSMAATASPYLRAKLSETDVA
jgi:hypothetical protein